MSLFPMNNGALPAKPSSVEHLVQSALLTNTKDPQSVSTAVAKLLPDKLKAFTNETKGLPRLPEPVEQKQGAIRVGLESGRIEDLVEGINTRFKDLLEEVDAEQDGPVIEAIQRAVLDAIDQGRTSAPKALSSNSRDMIFSVRTILRERAFELRARGIRAPALRRHYLDLADDVDQVAGVVLAIAGATVQQADSGTGETLLDISAAELRSRAEQVLRALDRLSGVVEHPYGPDRTNWPAQYNALRDWITRQAGGDQFRPYLVRDQLSNFMFRLVDFASGSGEGGFREARAAINAGRRFLDSYLRLLRAFARSAARRPIAANDPDRFSQFAISLLNFRNGFTGTAGRLIAIAGRPLVLQSWAQLRIPAFAPGGAFVRSFTSLPTLLLLRASAAQLQWGNVNAAGRLRVLATYIHAIDTVIDRSLRGGVLV